MSGAIYSLWLRRPTGELLVPGVLFSRLEWTRQENTFGTLKATLSPEFDTSLLALDCRFEIHREIGGRAYVEGDTQYLLRWWRYAEDANQKRSIQIEAYDLNYLLTSRIVAYPASTPELTNAYTTKTTQAIDNIIKGIVDSNLASASIDTDRINAEISIAPGLSLAPTTTKSFAKRRVLDILQELATESFERGTYLAFDFIPSGSGYGLTFQTYTGQRGVDHSAGSGNSLIISKENGNLAQPSLSFDHRNEYTYVYCGGKGEGEARVIGEASDTARIGQSPFGRRELWVDGRQTENSTILEADAKEKLQAARPLRVFTGKLLDTEGVRYGLQVNFGDLVTAEYRGASYDCHISKVHGVYDGEETLDIDLVSEALI